MFSQSTKILDKMEIKEYLMKNMIKLHQKIGKLPQIFAYNTKNETSSVRQTDYPL